MCDDWIEDETPYQPSHEMLTSPRSDRKRAYDSRGRRGEVQRQSSFRDSRRDENRDDGPKLEFLINSVDVGTVIGKGGSTIRETQNKFNVRISVDKNVSEYGKAKVVISGHSSAALNDCRNFIEDLLPKSPPANENSGGNGYDDGPIDWDAANRRSENAIRERWAKCPPLEKNFYKEHPDVKALSPEAVAEFRKNNMNIKVSRTFEENAKDSDPIPNPVLEFHHAFAEYPDLMEEIHKQGFKHPSPIQAQGWPVLLKGEDLIGIAQTGTGKTLAFLLPALIHIERQPVPRDQRGGPNVLILAPTRELAQQIENEVQKYQFRQIRACCVYGGGDRRKQVDIVKAGVQIIIATPGRFNDLVSNGIIDITSVTYLVLDEADRMLDMGFEPQIRKLLLDIRPDRQTVMTSATWPSAVRRLASSYMKNPIQVYVGSLDLAATHTVTQVIEVIQEDEKFKRIQEFVQSMGPHDKAIIFCGKKQRADDLSSDFSLMGIPVQSIHGDRDQSDREQALRDIKEGYVKILVATDVASRGIDIEDITHVVNYDFPRNIEEYVHRVGRTGRAGRSGVSLSLVTRSDWGSMMELIDILEEANQEVPTEIRNMAERFKEMKQRREDEKTSFGMGGGGGGRFGGGGGGSFSRRDDNRNSNALSFSTPSSNVGAIIGKGGSNIRETQEKYGVRIDVDKNMGSEAKITVKGSDFDGVKEAVEFLKLMCENTQTRDNDRHSYR
ncbi:probable ATP-dependent RNA helicase DDX43 [Culicoides brevitarsis]|uniref:probable ATP-dependent RNA helicase DDX43 n=1 Tax=Culicoides brevitarsis TaxID=469753 RepID=UPI00307B8DE9